MKTARSFYTGQADYAYYYLSDYIPVRYKVTGDLLQDRYNVFDFKRGNCPSSLKTKLIGKIRSIVAYNSNEWIICFIPASTSEKTRQRFSKLADDIKNITGYNVSLQAITNTYDVEAGHAVGKSNNPTESFSFNNNYFYGKKVLLIDDVYTRGRTFKDTARQLTSKGAKSVIGLFIAKTQHLDDSYICA